MSQKHLKKLESAIGLRDPETIDNQRFRIPPLTKYSYRTTWFIPPPPRGELASLTPHPVACEHGVARVATLERASFAPDNPDATINLMFNQKRGVNWRPT